MAHRSFSDPPETLSPSFSPVCPWIHGLFPTIEFAVVPSSSLPNFGDPGATLAHARLNSGDLTAVERSGVARSRLFPRLTHNPQLLFPYHYLLQLPVLSWPIKTTPSAIFSFSPIRKARLSLPYLLVVSRKGVHLKLLVETRVEVWSSAIDLLRWNTVRNTSPTPPRLVRSRIPFLLSCCACMPPWPAPWLSTAVGEPLWPLRREPACPSLAIAACVRPWLL
uniref:Uncharacterized protein n=1 Tax=Zea mays TaxID=4577 RepID=A0A804RRH7_MAIZE